MDSKEAVLVQNGDAAGGGGSQMLRDKRTPKKYVGNWLHQNDKNSKLKGKKSWQKLKIMGKRKNDYGNNYVRGSNCINKR